jgi:carboxypeptidase PM20D1
MPDPLANLQALVRIPTISRLDVDDTDWAPFREFVDLLPTLYPATHGALSREIVAEHSLLYRWRGRTDGAPAVLMAHYDVVSATDDGWDHPPFSAELLGVGEEQLVWGRGTLDDKGSLVSVLEGVEANVLAGHAPESDIYLSFGHDEETAGSGAKAIVDLLQSRGIRPGLVIDEGGAVVEGIFPGVSGPIGVSEKGILSLTLTVEQGGGHASTPPRFSATAALARAIVRLNRRPSRAGFTPPTLEMIRTIGAHANNPLRWVFTNLRLTSPLLLALFGRLSDETNAMIRTTQAVTMLQGSQAANALAERAVATVNIRVAIDSSVEDAVEHVRRAIHDPLVAITTLHRSGVGARAFDDRRDVSRHDRDALRDDGRERQQALRAHQRFRLPLQPVRDVGGGTRQPARQERAHPRGDIPARRRVLHATRRQTLTLA